MKNKMLKAHREKRLPTLEVQPTLVDITKNWNHTNYSSAEGLINIL